MPGILAFYLNRRGEIKTRVVGYKWSAEKERQLLSQLQTINTRLGRVLPTLESRAVLPDEAD